MKTYVWCEDSAAGFTFWKKLFSVLYKDFIVETKRNNSGLCNSASKIKDDDNKYYIFIDNSIDNPDVFREVQRLYAIVRDKKNVTVIRIHSFEFVILSFQMLEKWVFAEEDELKEKRAEIIKVKNAFVKVYSNIGDSAELSLVKNYFQKSKPLNSEQMSSKLLLAITRNTGFEIRKGKIGDCFMVDCCKWKDRKDDDICGLDNKYLTSEEKIKEIFENSILKDSFREAGL